MLELVRKKKGGRRGQNESREATEAGVTSWAGGMMGRQETEHGQLAGAGGRVAWPEHSWEGKPLRHAAWAGHPEPRKLGKKVER